MSIDDLVEALAEFICTTAHEGEKTNWLLMADEKKEYWRECARFELTRIASAIKDHLRRVATPNTNKHTNNGKVF